MVKDKKKKGGRVAWNATVQSIAKTAGAELPVSPGPRRRETRKRAAKTKKARWIEEFRGDTTELGAWARLDVLLDAPRAETTTVAEDDGGDDADYREVDSDAEEEEEADGASSKRRGPKRKGKRGSSPKPPSEAPKKKQKTSAAAAEAAKKRRAPRTLARVIADDFAVSRGAAYAPADAADYVGAAARPSRRKCRRVCVVTGRRGTYKDPETGLYFADSEAGALLRENAPPWLGLHRRGSPYFEAMLQVRTERGAGRPPEAEASDAEEAPRYHSGVLLAPGQNPGDPDPPGWYRGRRFE